MVFLELWILIFFIRNEFCQENNLLQQFFPVKVSGICLNIKKKGGLADRPCGVGGKQLQFLNSIHKPTAMPVIIEKVSPLQRKYFSVIQTYTRRWHMNGDRKDNFG